LIHPWTPLPLGFATAAMAPQGSSAQAQLVNTWWWNSVPWGGLGDNRYPGGVFKWCLPLNDEDGQAGRICDRSGIWFPGHMLVEVDGKIMGRPFSYLMKEQPDIMPGTWGAPSE
jgi:hypothetical protein